MKSLLFAAALMVSGTALAQTEPAPAGGQPVAAGNTAPERDARGIPVVSDPATAPAGTNEMVTIPPGAQVVVNPNQTAAFTPQPAAEVSPPCSRTVTDNCTQTYEGGRARRPRR